MKDYNNMYPTGGTFDSYLWDCYSSFGASSQPMLVAMGVMLAVVTLRLLCRR